MHSARNLCINIATTNMNHQTWMYYYDIPNFLPSLFSILNITLGTFEVLGMLFTWFMYYSHQESSNTLENNGLEIKGC